MPQESQTRYHGLDALRGIAMMLGIVLHAALPYVEPYTWDDFSTYWPQDSDASFVIAVINDFIHSWRMPTFFILSGFFTHLVITRNSLTLFCIENIEKHHVVLNYNIIYRFHPVNECSLG